MTVNILCLDNPLGAWDESSLAKGIGGSETAVIGLAKLLRENGNFVWVSNDTDKNAGGKGVGFKDFGERKQSSSGSPVHGITRYVNKENMIFEDIDVHIVWRNPADLLKIKDRSGRKILWLHDLIPESEVIQYQHFCDKIWVPSLFHRGIYPSIPDEKFVVLPSGITPLKSLKTKRANLLCYTSDYNRGLDILLDIWPRYRFAFPDDELVIAYGKETQDALAKSADKVRGDDNASRAWEYRWQLLQKRMAMKGVSHKGKLSKQELADLYEESSIMAYPSIFPETQCLVVLDALAHGCIPVTTGLGALQETNNGGYQLPPDADASANNYLQLLVEARGKITNGRRTAGRSLVEAYTWSSLYGRIKREILGA